MPGKILIIDDDPVILKYLKAIFTDNGYTVFEAANSTDGMAIVDAEKPDLITLDLEMPGEWGSRFYRKLRKDKNLRNIPILVISGLDGDHAVKDAIAFIAKPFDPDEVLAIVKEAIG